MTGSRAQLYNGIALLFTFFSCRLIWGTFQSACVYWDMWHAIQTSPDAGYLAAAHAEAKASMRDNVMAFATDAHPVPIWLAGIYLAANVTLNTLNWYWFYKMIHAVRKRFEPAPAKTEVSDEKTSTTGETTGTEKASGETRKRRNTIDSQELQEGTIQ
jgi:hypothetical protein